MHEQTKETERRGGNRLTDRQKGRQDGRQTDRQTDKKTARGEEVVNTHNKDHYCQRK